MLSFFAFKNYVAFNASSLSALKNDLEQRKQTRVLENPQKTFDEAWMKSYTNIIEEINSSEIRAKMVWRVYSAPRDTTMFVHAILDATPCMFFHVPYRAPKSTDGLARYFEFFVAAFDQELNRAKVLSIPEWENMKKGKTILEISAVVIVGSLPIEDVFTSFDAVSMQKGYYDGLYWRECDNAMTELHTSEFIIDKIANQAYLLEEEEVSKEATVFTFDKYPRLRSISDMQALPKRLCLVKTTKRGVQGLMRATSKQRTLHTPTFSLHKRTFFVDGSELQIEEILKRYFVSNEYEEYLIMFMSSDPTREVESVVPQYFQEAQELYPGHSSSNAVNVSPYVAAACLVFLTALEEDPQTFVRVSVKDWLQDVNFNDFKSSIEKRLTAAWTIFYAYLHLGNSKPFALNAWYLSKEKIVVGSMTSPAALPTNYSILRATNSSIFNATENTQSHIVTLSAFIFSILGVRITAFGDEGVDDVYEKSVSACLEAALIMEILFPQTRIVRTESERGLLADCRLWIAAWLFTFKIIVDRDVRNEKINSILWSMRARKRNSTHSKRDYEIFVRLFSLDNTVYVPRHIGALIPTIIDLRRHIEKTGTLSIPINFTNVYNVALDNLHWITIGDDLSENYNPVKICYSGDVSATSYGDVMYGEEKLPLEYVGEALRRLFILFFGTEEQSRATRAALETLTSMAFPMLSEYALTIKETIDEKRHMAFNIEKSSSYRRSALLRAHVAAKESLATLIQSIDAKDMQLIAWFAHSDYMKEVKEEQTFSAAMKIIRGAAKQLLDSRKNASQMELIYASMKNPFCADPLSIYSTHNRKSLNVYQQTRAQFNIKGGIDSIDSPLSFNGAVLAKNGYASRRHIEGFPATFNHEISDLEMLARRYNAYAALVCTYKFNANKKTNAPLLDRFFDTLAAKFYDNYRLSSSVTGNILSQAAIRNLRKEYSDVVDSDVTPEEWCLLRDVVAAFDNKPILQREPQEQLYVPVQDRTNGSLVAYLEKAAVPVISAAIRNLYGYQSSDSSLFATTRYSIAHYFSNASVINATEDATMLLRLLAADNFKTFDFYAPISGYIHSSLAGHIQLPSKSKTSLYRPAGDYLSSRRTLGNRSLQSTLFTGYTPVVDAYSRAGGIHQMKKVAEASLGCEVSRYFMDGSFLLLRSDDTTPDFGVLAGEVTRVQFTVYTLPRVHVDAQKIHSEFFAEQLKTIVFNPSELYPVDEYTWFQFVDAVPADPIPSYKLQFVDVLDKAGKKPRAPAAASSRRSKKVRIGAQIFESPNYLVFEEKQRFLSMLRARMSAYKRLRNDNNDSTFRRDFVDFYARHILVNIGNTDNVYLGSTDEYDAVVRYFGTPILSQRTAEDKKVVDAFLSRPEDVKILMVTTFPRWKIVLIGQRNNAVVVARPVMDIEDDDVGTYAALASVLVGSTYNVTRVPAGDILDYNFFAMLRYMQVILKRPEEYRLASSLSVEEQIAVNKGLLENMDMIDEALAAVAGVQKSEDLDWRDQMFIDTGISKEDKERLRQSGYKGYLTDTILQWYSSWLALKYKNENPMPREKFEIESSLLSTLLTNKRTKSSLRQKPRPNAELHFYPWYDAARSHYYLIFVHFPTKTAVSIDSLYYTSQKTLERNVASIISYYASTQSTSLVDWSITSLNINVPMQPNGHQCGDYVMSNIEYIIDWLINDKASFEDAIALLRFTGQLYSEEQMNAVHALASTFRDRVFDLAKTTPSQEELADSIEVVDDQDEIVILNDSSSEEIRVLNPAVSFDSSEDKKPSPMYVYPTCTVTGYEINAQRFGNRLRYVRYGKEHNVEFQSIPRTASNYTEEPSLHYWNLRETEPIPPGAELVAREPAGDLWKRLILTGYPYAIKQPKSAHSKINITGTIGPTLGLNARILPLVAEKKSSERFVASPLPIHAPRTTFNSIMD